jgi:SARP family transcriptional regulator, regulator of embCAB operon
MLPITIVVRVDEAAPHLTGRIGRQGAPARPFAGRLALFSAFEAELTREAAEDDAGEPEASGTVVRLCGGLAARMDGRDVGEAIPAGQCRSLFAYLVLRRGRVLSRDELIDALWPSHPPSDPQAVLSTLLSRLRAAIAPAVLRTRAGVSLELPEPVDVDVERAARLIADGRAEAALRLLDGDVLPGRCEPWVEERRREAEDMRLAALERVATSALHDPPGDLAAEQAARALVARAPFRETGYALLMGLLARRGDTAEALRVYEQLRRLLRDELGMVPSGAVLAVHRRLLAGWSSDAEMPRAA